MPPWVPVGGSRVRAGTPHRSAAASPRQRGGRSIAGRPANAFGEARGNRKRRQAEVIDRSGKLGDPLDHGSRVETVADIALSNRRRRHCATGTSTASVAGDCGKIRCQRRTSPAHRLEIGHGRDRETVLQPHQHLRAVIAAARSSNACVKRRLRSQAHELAGGGKLALVGQLDRDDSAPSFFRSQSFHRERAPLRRRGRRHRTRSARRS